MTFFCNVDEAGGAQGACLGWVAQGALDRVDRLNLSFGVDPP